MNLATVNTIISLVFPPSFVLLIHFFNFSDVAFTYGAIVFLYMLFLIVKKEKLKSISTPIIYFAFIVIAYMLKSMAFIKLIPVLISATFFFVFLNAYIQNQTLILNMTKKFYRNLDQKKADFIAKGDGYWALVIFINTLVQLGLVFYDNNELWAFYSSIGWYILMFVALVLQIVYGHFYGIIMANKGEK
jgi:uncharacterized membrane protein